MELATNNRRYLIPVLGLFIIYLFWLFRGYYDVAYMDQIQIIAGNLNHMYNNDVTLHDYYYRPPFLLVISTLLVYINSKLFGYNTFYENIVSALLLFTIAAYFIRASIPLFLSRKYRTYFAIMAAIIVFSFAKWEMSLWGGGFSHFMVVLFGFICVNSALKYFQSGDQGNSFSSRYFVPLYLGLSVLAILETTSYYLPFQLSLLVLLILSYKLFRDKINLQKWKRVLVLTIGLIIFSFLVNYLAELYSIRHPYDAYGKVNLSQSIGESTNKIFTEPLFVIKFFLVSIAGNLIDKDSYAAGSFVKTTGLPALGLIVLLLYAYAVFFFIKKRRIEYIYFISLIIYTIIFCGMVLIGRMNFNDVYYGGSSRYSTATFSGLLGLLGIFLHTYQHKQQQRSYKNWLYLFPPALIIVCTMFINRNQWRLAPFYKMNFLKMEENYKLNRNLESLFGYNNVITSNARRVLIRNKLNVFKPRKKLNNYVVGSFQISTDAPGFLGPEKDQFGEFRWTDGDGITTLPNLYNINDTFKVKIICYSPQLDTPRLVLNDNLFPFQSRQVDGGYEYSFATRGTEVLYRAEIMSKSIVPQKLNKDSPDTRKLGLIFRSFNFYE